MATRKNLKTVDVKKIVTNFNRMITLTNEVEAKKAFCTAIETVLFEADRYHGFQYNTPRNTWEVYYAKHQNGECESPIRGMIADGILTEYDRRYIID